MGGFLELKCVGGSPNRKNHHTRRQKYLSTSPLSGFYCNHLMAGEQSLFTPIVLYLKWWKNFLAFRTYILPFLISLLPYIPVKEWLPFYPAFTVQKGESNLRGCCTLPLLANGHFKQLYHSYYTES